MLKVCFGRLNKWQPYYSFPIRYSFSMNEKEAEKSVYLEMRNLKLTELQRLKNRGKKG